MGTNLIKDIARKSQDVDGLSPNDWWCIDKLHKDRVGFSKVNKVLHIFRDNFVDAYERRQLIKILILDASAQKQLNAIIGRDGKRLLINRHFSRDGVSDNCIPHFGSQQNSGRLRILKRYTIFFLSLIV